MIGKRSSPCIPLEAHAGIGEFATIAELAEREGIAFTYMARVLRLTLLAPDIVEAILDGKQGAEVTLKGLMEPFPLEWRSEMELLF